MSGLGKSNNFSGPYKLGTVLKWGRCKGSSVQEIIDDGQCSLIQFYIDEQMIELDNEAYSYLSMNCDCVSGRCLERL